MLQAATGEYAVSVTRAQKIAAGGCCWRCGGGLGWGAGGGLCHAAAGSWAGLLRVYRAAHRSRAATLQRGHLGEK